MAPSFFPLLSRPAWLPRQLHVRTKVIVFCVLVLHILLVLVLRHRVWPLGFDARSYLQAAQAVVDGRPLIELDHPELLGWDSADDTPPYLYPPFLALLLTPLTLVSPTVVYGLWFTIIIAASLLLVALLRSLLGWRVASIAVLLFLPTWLSVGLGQINVFIAVLYGLTLHAAQRQHMERAGLWLMVGTLLKLVPALGLVVLAAQRSWRSLAVAGATGAAMVAVTLPFVGLAAWYDGVIAATSMDWRLRGMISWTGQAAYWLGDGAALAVYGIGAIFLLATLVRAPKLPPLLALSAAMILPLLFARVTWDHHALMALPALAVIWQLSPRGRVLAASTWFFLSLVSGITMPIMLTICWTACCWPHLLDHPQQQESAPAAPSSV